MLDSFVEGSRLGSSGSASWFVCVFCVASCSGGSDVVIKSFRFFGIDDPVGELCTGFLKHIFWHFPTNFLHDVRDILSEAIVIQYKPL